MLKKLFGVLAIVFIISLFLNTAVYAANKVDIYDPKTPATEQTIFVITRPEGKEATYNKSYEICGYTKKEKVTIELLILKDSKYVELKDTNGDSKWTNVGPLFAKEIVLNEEENFIRIVAYSENNPDEVQISDLTIKYVKKNVVDKIKEEIYDALSKMFSLM